MGSSDEEIEKENLFNLFTWIIYLKYINFII